jgi:hypothetical protein
MREFDTEFIGENWIESSQLAELKKELVDENERLIQAVADAKTKDEIMTAQDELESFNDEYASLVRDIETAEITIAPLWEKATLISENFFTEYTERMMVDTGYISFEFPGYHLIDWDKLAESMLQDYNRVDIGGCTYYSRA